jgi:hypothetical protein
MFILELKIRVNDIRTKLTNRRIEAIQELRRKLREDQRLTFKEKWLLRTIVAKGLKKGL